MPATATPAPDSIRSRPWVATRRALNDRSEATPHGLAARSRVSRVFLGAADEQRWARPLLWVLLLAAAALYLVDLSSSGTANSFYAAAVKSGTESWKAWLFGSLDSASSITVDKPPAALWLMVLSARIFGFSSFSMLLPQALMGVATVGVTNAAVKRWSGPAAGLIAGALVALTPVAALMFRFNNPDALLVLLMTVAAYCVIRAVDAPIVRRERSRALRWMLLAGTAIGLAFLTKMAQGLLVLPAFGLVYLIASPLRIRARIGHLLAAAGALVVSAGWFIALVEIWPASARPYIGGSTNNSLWELAVGYNGLGRIFSGAGNGGGGGGGGGGGTNTAFGGSTGITRMFGTSFGSEISWLIPAALIGLLAGLWFTRRAPRSDRTRAGLVLWGAWLVVTALVFSFMSGTIHPYYVLALVPAVAGSTAISARLLWQRRDSHIARCLLALMIAATAAWGWYLMGRDASGWMTWVRWTMLIGGVLGALGLAVSTGALKKFAVAAALVGSLAALGGTASFTAATAASAHSGSTPVAGPAIAGGTGGMGGAMGGQAPSGTRPSGTAPAAPSSTTQGSATGSSSATGTSGMEAPTGGSRQGGGDASSNTALVALLDQTTTTWSAATVGDQSAAGYILSTDTAVIAIGGWSGSDASPTLAQFQQYVKDGKVTYFIAGGSMSGGGGSSSSSVGNQITTWVSAHYTATTVGGTTVYKLTS